ncbi:MAG TPA: dihydrodipicolinate synthase family protein [Casimicrobiaceae bacterium]|nr:dihydrodipicolinate synthase family protein [Casimicrobiaceae bacterium]
MNPNLPLQGLWCATLSPLDAAGGLDSGRLAMHARRLFASGVDGIAPFGTTGEGQSFSVAERRAGLDALLAAGIAPQRILAATGCAALPDAIELTRHAISAGCAGALVLPPFFFKDVSDEGIYAAYAQLIDGVGDNRLRVYLYHIPQVSGVGLSVATVSRLAAAYPAIVAGVKDSAGSFENSRALVAALPGLSIFVGHEPHLPALRKLGGAGTICGIANLYPHLMRRLYDHSLDSNPGAELPLIEAFIAALMRFPIFGALKSLQAELSGDAGWRGLRAPLLPLSDADARALKQAVAAAGIVPERDGA